MNLRQLLYFKTIVERKSIAAASEALHIAQPPLSQHLKSLEADYGVQLFERQGRGLLVTDAGLHLYRRACELLSLADEIDAEMRGLAQGISGKVSIGTVTSGVGCVARVMADLKRQLPQILFSVYHAEPAALEDMLQARQLDFAVSQWPVTNPLLHTVALQPLALMAVEALPGRLPEGSTCTLAELARVPLIVVRRRQGHGFYERVQQAFAAAGLRPEVAFECSDIAAALALAAAGAGVALLPVWPGETVQSGLHQRRVEDLPSEERLVLAWLAERDRLPAVAQAVKAFEQLIAD
ncbi:LysR family transcriptional regulator [Pseudomonas sp.]|uniref:LysR family transcriptional regulator n=1 Tax=Pseudomonas sp. TaxID=306 RepID=UPI002585E961|nr:LysR family transcriptional regulator [Pseudomonas sp.]